MTQTQAWDGTTVCTPWTSIDDVLICSKCEGYEADTLENAIGAASDILFHLSGRQYPGECTDTVRPCANRSGYNYTWQQRYNHRWNDQWGYCGCQGNTCECGTIHSIRLPGFPVRSITQVKQDGVVLNPLLYRVDDWRDLVRRNNPDGTNPGWPYCQHLELESTEPNTLEVTYVYGADPPSSGRMAAAELACELALSCAGSDACSLPKRITSITRQGMTIAVLDTFNFLQTGRTGIYNVDLFLAAVNPTNTRGPGVLWRPGRGTKTRRTGTG